MFHGLNALLLAWLGWTAARRVDGAVTATSTYEGPAAAV
jgi:hypothetical protein